MSCILSTTYNRVSGLVGQLTEVLYGGALDAAVDPAARLAKSDSAQMRDATGGQRLARIDETPLEARWKAIELTMRHSDLQAEIAALKERIEDTKLAVKSRQVELTSLRGQLRPLLIRKRGIDNCRTTLFAGICLWSRLLPRHNSVLKEVKRLQTKLNTLVGIQNLTVAELHRSERNVAKLEAEKKSVYQALSEIFVFENPTLEKLVMADDY